MELADDALATSEEPRRGASESLDHQRAIEAVLSSPPVGQLRAALRRVGATIDSRPLLTKCLPGPFLRLVFPVRGQEIEDGTVIAAVCLFDPTVGRTLYAHPMHAGPEVNPLLKHLHGPMASPKAQTGANGDRATLRMIEHKRALWHRFRVDRLRLGEEVAGRRWRAAYYWALQRLYFCAQCPVCRWGSEFYAGPSGERWELSFAREARPVQFALSEAQAQLVSDITGSDAFRVEAAYAARGKFLVDSRPRLLTASSDGCARVLFPTDVRDLEPGSLVAVAVTFHLPSRETAWAQCLSAGPEAEILFRRGAAALGLPPLQPNGRSVDAFGEYELWRRNAWTEFWLDELDFGIKVASARWLSAFWAAMETLFGRNELHRIGGDPQPCRSRPDDVAVWEWAPPARGTVAPLPPESAPLR